MTPPPAPPPAPTNAPLTSSTASLSDPEGVELLLQFVRNRDVHCPRCDYNLRNLTQPVCPECREPLRLNVGVQRVRFEWLIAALAPGIFSGIAATIITGMLVIALIIEGPPQGRVPWIIFATVGFGWLSAIAAVLLFARRHWFLKQSRERQISMAVGSWFVHVAYFLIVLAIVVR